jgi:hypothetical protein
MKTLDTCLIVGMALAMPVAAFAQSNTADATYCTELSHKYQKYVSSDQGKRPRPAPANVAEAMSKCQSGDTASAIPILEKALTDQKIALPPRS